MSILNKARFYQSRGVPVPMDLAFQLMAQGIDPDALPTQRGTQ